MSNKVYDERWLGIIVDKHFINQPRSQLVYESDQLSSISRSHKAFLEVCDKKTYPTTDGNISSTSSKQKVVRSIVRFILTFTSISLFYIFLENNDDTFYIQCLSRVNIRVILKVQPTDFSSYNFLLVACLLAWRAYALTPVYCIIWWEVPRNSPYMDVISINPESKYLILLFSLFYRAPSPPPPAAKKL